MQRFMRPHRLGGLLLLCALAGAAQADYELGDTCKPQDGWQRMSGSCDADGLQGDGTASYANAVFRGRFVNGLPEGVHSVEIFRDKDDIKQDLNRQRYGGRLAEILMCKMAFIAGKPVVTDLSCTYSTYGVKVTLKPTQIVMAVQKSKSRDSVGFQLGRTVVSATTRISGSMPFHNSAIFGVQIDGIAEDVALGYPTSRARLDIDLVGLTGKATSLARPPHGAYEIQGTFDYKLLSLVMELNHVPDTGKPVGPVDPKSVYEFNVSGYPMTAAFYAGSMGSAQNLYYFKSAFASFDAAGFPLCRQDSRLGLNGDDRGMATVNFDNLGINSSGVRLQPVCGKVTDKNGRSFAGYFDRQGRPIGDNFLGEN